VSTINKSQILVAFTVFLLLSMTIYHNGHFRDLFSYYEHAGEKTYDLDNDGWTVNLDSEFEMADDFDLMLKNIDGYEYPANSVLVVNQGTIVREKYYNEFTYRTEFNTYSVTKSFTSTLIGIAIDQGIIGSVNDPIVSYFPNTTFDNDSPEKQRVTIKHVLTMTSGFDYGVDPTLAPPVEGSIALHVLNSPVSREPGTSWVYDSQAPSILNRIIEIQSSMSLMEFANETLFHPLGIQDPKWGTDDSGLTYGGFGLYLTSREMAKLGQLFLQDGIWESEQLVSKEWVQESTSEHMPENADFVYSVRPPSDYGYLWWVHDGFYIASGLHGQRIIVNPENDYVLVITSLDVTQQGANDLHASVLDGNFEGWKKPMNQFYKRSIPYFGLLLISFTGANSAFLKYGSRDKWIKSKDSGQEIVLTSFASSFYSVTMGFLTTLSVIFVALDLFFSSSRGILFPKFQLLTIILLILSTISIILLEREIVRYRHGADYTGMLKFEIPKAILFLVLTIFLFFRVYLKMVEEFSGQ